MDYPVYKLAGIGIGPFNLGLAAIAHGLGMNCLFADAADSFNWHPGMLLEDTRLQVPFFGDLVTPVDPCSRYSYLSYLHAQQRLFRFAIREQYFIKRVDYNRYCRWVANQLPSLRFNSRCNAISYNEEHDYYRIHCGEARYAARRLVIGVGTVPQLPACAMQSSDQLVLHSSDYLSRKHAILQQPSISLIGSGQSAAEIFYDLLKSYSGQLDWFTRSDGFLPMDYSPFSLEKTSVDYINYFYDLPADKKASVLEAQQYLYKGINAELLSAIYDTLDEGPAATVSLHPNCMLTSIDPTGVLDFWQVQQARAFQHRTHAVVLATGYQAVLPDFIRGIEGLVQWDEQGRYQVNRNYSIDRRNTLFVQNADLHTHGFTSPDLGMAPYRNAIILNTVLGYEHFKLEKGFTFQRFGLE